MIERIADLPDHVLGFTASGEVTESDYRTVLVPALEEKLSQARRVRLLYVLGDAFEGYTGGAAWEDAKVGLKHLTGFDRVAVVTDVDWVRNTVRAFGFVMPSEVRVFGNDRLDEARAWISEPAATGKLSFELVPEKGVLILRPKGELEAADFERLSDEIDHYIAQRGGLAGLMIVADGFPGWEDFSAFAAHLRFIREHRDKLKRLAVVTDDRVLAAMPRIARHLIVPEARQFASQESEEALAWVSGET